jgi:dipeptidyl aminopeptidase/acylaminoacyl peptidase
VSYPGGEVERITDDLNLYGDMTLDISRDGRKLVSTRTRGDLDLWALPMRSNEPPRRLTSGSNDYDGERGVCAAADGRIFFSSEAAGNRDVWAIDPDGSNRKRLTTHPRFDADPSVTPDGQHLLFVSNRTKGFKIWKMDLDGANPTEVTTEGGFNPFGTPDGWVVYAKGDTAGNTIRRIPLSGGESSILVQPPVSSSLYGSPDGHWMAIRRLVKGMAWQVEVMPTSGSEPVAVFDDLGSSKELAFSRDSQALLYRKSTRDEMQIWARPIRGGPDEMVARFDTRRYGNAFITGWFAPLPDGEEIVCSVGTWVEDLILVEAVE